MTVETKSPLRQLREALSMTQEKLAKAAFMTVQWYQQIENQGANTSYTTARNILSAINGERQARNLPVLALDELHLTIV